MPEEEARACKKCGTVYQLNRENFGSMPSGGLRHTCRKCVRANVRAYDNASPERKQAARQRVERRRGESLTSADRAAIAPFLIKKYGGRRCYYCAENLGDNLHIDHRLPIAKGGMSDLDNLVLACVQCNQEKHGKTVDEYRAWRMKNRLPVQF